MKEFKGILDSLQEGFLIISGKSLRYINDSLNRYLFGKRKEDNIIIEKEEAHIFEALKRMKLNDSQISFLDIIKGIEMRGFFHNKEEQFVYMQNDNQCSFTVRKFDINFNNEFCIAFTILNQASGDEIDHLKNQIKQNSKVCASITHDLKTPINGIIGILKIIYEKVSSLEIKELIETSLKSSDLLLFLIRDILDSAQIDAESLKLNISSTPIRKISNECIAIMANDFKQKDVSLRVKISNNVLSEIMSDENIYKQILINLLSNAFKHSYRGGHVTIKIKFNEEENILKTSVIDTGLGIKPENIPKLFKPFGKVIDINNMNPNSVGLGRNICKNLARKLGGDIGVKSIYKKGSKFFFCICYLKSNKFEK